jgi:hypothetical protein
MLLALVLGDCRRWPGDGLFLVVRCTLERRLLSEPGRDEFLLEELEPGGVYRRDPGDRVLIRLLAELERFPGD